MRAQLARILASRRFANAPRLSRFLRYITERTVGGKGGGLKESLIGLEVFDRRPSVYDPGTDPIVRVQASRLRARLAEYYKGEGSEDPLVIELPRGHYIPTFRTGRPEPQRSEAAGSGASIVVLPFVNISSDPENEYFSDGLTEELIHSLARLGSLHVAARTSAFQFKGVARDVREIGHRLGMSKVLEGSVRKSGERLRITAQLVNVEDGCQLWSERYDRTVTDLFEIQDEIAAAIRNALAARLTEEGPPAPVRRPTRNIEAFNHYLLGRYQWNKRTEAGFQAGIEHFHEAIRLDPGYARAYSGLADCYIMLGMSAARAPQDSMPLARQAAAEALEIDDCLAEAHNSLAMVMAAFHWDHEGAQQEFQRALGLDPSYATLHHWHSLCWLAARGQAAEAVEELEWAIRLDPISLPILADLALAHILSGDDAAAIEQCRRVMELDDTYHRAYWFLGLAREQQGDFQGAMEALEKALALCGGSAFRLRILGAMGLSLGRGRQRAKAREVLGRMEAFEGSYVDQFELAQVRIGLGEADRALKHLEQGVEERSCFLLFLKLWPAFRGLHGDSRFQSILSRLSLAGTVT